MRQTILARHPEAVPGGAVFTRQPVGRPAGRRRSRVTRLIVALSAAPCVALPAQAIAGTLDQQQTLVNAASGIDGASPDGPGFSTAQTFTPGASGLLDQVDLLLARFPATAGPLTVEIRNASGGVPGSTVLASASVPAADVPVEQTEGFDWIPVSFASPALVTSGTQYAIVAYTDVPGHYGWGQRTTLNAYANGRAFGVFQSPPTTWLTFGANVDFTFKTYVFVYPFSGFFSPVDNAEVNLANAGSSVPAKFSLGGDQGLDVLADGYPKLVFYECNPGADVDPIEETSTANNGLTYDSVSDTYTYVWKTEKGWSGKCGTFTLKLDDGTVHEAKFAFK